MKIQNLGRPWIIAAIVITLVSGFIFIRWWNRDIVPIKTAVIAIGPIESVVSASGVVDAPVYDLGPKLGGKIVSLYVKEGSRVFSGMTLAEFDDTTRLVAPNNGIVAKINFLEGETVVPGSPAIVVVNYDKSWVEAQIDEIDIGSVKVGEKVKITTDVYPDKVFEGEIYWISPLAELRKVGGRIKLDEESYVFPCKIKFLGDHKDLKVNMSVNVDIVTKTSMEALLVPREALVSRDDSTYVFAVKENRVYEKKIDVGIRSFGSVEAISGLTHGDAIAITNISKLKNKGRVKIEQ
ncbi:efflux RND transporter periplasmic adaptor subunit [Candidatus Saganbacteria bacterium]|nr:efflux RND transporter periplasmic adaptor subunit [Candidatus Saganbacteria bacterium]